VVGVNLPPRRIARRVTDPRPVIDAVSGPGYTADSVLP
jgi:hypothetical protein